MSTIRQLIDGFVWEHLEYFTAMVEQGGEDTVFEGVRVLDEPEKFVQGTLVHAAARLFLHYKAIGDETRAAVALRRLQLFLPYVCTSVCKTWGKFAVLRALSALHDAGCLSVIDEDTLSVLKQKTQYIDFIDKERCDVIGYPSNYLHVGMACAGLREKLGWDTDAYSDKLRDKLFSVMTEGACDGWMDEQPPFGRFDRYSIIVTSELSDTLGLLGRALPAFAADNLALAAKLCLFCANDRGDGINYGRSLSCHGDCGTVEIISSALARGLVPPSQHATAVVYTVRVIEKTLSYWYDKARRSFNIWWDGRATNGYRGVKRVLEVNLDMAFHLIYLLENIEKAGLADVEPNAAAMPAPACWTTYEVLFRDTPHNLAKTVTLRRGDTLAMLPMIGLGNHCGHAAYQPYPAISELLEGAPEGELPYLIPQYTLEDGTLCRPTQFYDSIETVSDGDTVIVTARGTMATFVRPPQRAVGHFTATYRFEGATITASFAVDAPVGRIAMMVGTHHDTDDIQAVGFDAQTPLATDAVDFRTPHGAITQAALHTKCGNGVVGYVVAL